DGTIEPADDLHEACLSLSDVLWHQYRSEGRRYRESRDQASGDSVGVCLRHRPEDMTFHTAQREERNKADDDDRGRKKDGAVDLDCPVEQPKPLAAHTPA